MKKFKILLGLLVFVLTLSFLEIRVNAINEPMILNINETRPFSDDDGDGTVGNDKYTIFSNPAQTIFKIGERLETSEELQYLKSLYCLRFGLGFGAENTDIQNLQDITYNKLGNLKTNVDEIIEYYTNTVGYNNIDTEYTYIDTDNEEYLFTPYNCILWLADNIALINENIQITDSEIVDLLTNAGIFPLPQNNTLKLTLDDIDVIQQCAFWTFSNYAGFIKEDQAIDNLLKINTSNLDEIDTTRQRGKQVKKLYDYLVTSAKKGAASYGTGNVRPINGEVNLPGVELETTLSATVFEKSFEYNGISNSYYVVGPFKLNITNPNDSWNIDVVPTFGYKSTITATEYTIINRAMLITINNEVVTNFNYDIKDGEQFYVAINKDSMDGATIVEFKLSIDYTYSRIDRIATLWTAEPSDQPVLLVEDEVIDGNGNTETVVENRKPDFALRKYITKIEIDGEEVTIASRVPVPDTSTLTTGESTTAIYKHLKTPVEVKTGDIVTYTIAVYNEGNIEGRVTKITDYIPAGLEYDATLNTDITANLDGNKLEITLNGNNLPAFTGEGISSTSVSVKLRVTATQNQKDQVFTNIAEISAFALEGEEINSDRDSTPDNLEMPTDLENYWGTDIIQGLTESENYYVGQEDDDDFEKVFIRGVNADFALRKYITRVERNGEEVIISSRVPSIDFSNIKPTKDMARETTATYKHSKKPVEVKTGDIVTYTIAVYNEGQIEGKVTEIIDYLPDGIEFVPEKNPDFVAVRDGDDIQNLSEDDIQEILQEAETTKKYLYQILDNKLIIKYLEEYTLNPITADTDKLDSKEINIVCKVIAIEQDADLVLTNMAEISEYEVEGDIEDRDSKPNYPAIPTDLENYWGTNIIQGETESENYYVGQEDDDDFEKVVIKGANFDLALRKFISSIKRNGEEILDEDRSPEVDISTLTTTTTASYTHSKDAVTVKTGDIVTYTLRVYNEGELNGYVNTITEHIPEGLEFILDSDVNTTYMWTFENVLNINTINTNYWSKVRTDNGEVEGLLKGYDGGRDLDYRDVKIEFKVIAPNTYENEIVNIAEISNSVAVNENNQILNISDRDSVNPVNIENYILKPAPENSTYQEDDDDYERLQVRYFDLALRKFITAVNETEVTSRIPEVVLNEETGDLEYIHDKTPVEVVNADLVTYTIRVYNEGSIAGYAEEIVDDIPAGLVYIPTNTVNKSYRWKMLDSQGNETENVEEAVRLTTDYLSEAYGNTLMSDEDNINPNLINPFDSNLPISNIEPFNPDYRDVKLVFQVDDSAVPVENEDRIIINHAQIAEDSDDDEDSTPGEWIDGEDDQDVESIYVKTFDLSLQKWVTKTIVTIDGVTTTTETGFKPNVGLTEQEGRPNNENEPLAQVVIDKKKINKTEVKFVYSIRVANEGDIAGYATEITDYIPEGLKFVQEDNPIWEKVGETKIVTHALETTLLNPGESKEIEVIFTWINDENNLGVKTNIAAITADYNEYGDAADIDSTPGDIDITQYDHEQEDDDDYALVILTVKTGGGNSYIAIGLVVIAIIATGIVLIKRYVL